MLSVYVLFFQNLESFLLINWQVIERLPANFSFIMASERVIEMYNNPYMQQYQNPYTMQNQQMQQRYEIIKVNGENGARAFQMAPNSAVLLLDESQPILWLKATDGAGYPTITPYTITPMKTEPVPDVASLEARIARLEEKLNESHSERSKPEK